MRAAPESQTRIGCGGSLDRDRIRLLYPDSWSDEPIASAGPGLDRTVAAWNGAERPSQRRDLDREIALLHALARPCRFDQRVLQNQYAALFNQYAQQGDGPPAERYRFISKQQQVAPRVQPEWSQRVDRHGWRVWPFRKFFRFFGFHSRRTNGAGTHCHHRDTSRSVAAGKNRAATANKWTAMTSGSIPKPPNFAAEIEWAGLVCRKAPSRSQSGPFPLTTDQEAAAPPPRAYVATFASPDAYAMAVNVAGAAASRFIGTIGKTFHAKIARVNSRPAWHRHRSSFRAGGLHDWHSQCARLRVCDRSGRRAPHLRLDRRSPAHLPPSTQRAGVFQLSFRQALALRRHRGAIRTFGHAGRRHGGLRSRSPSERRSPVPCPRTRPEPARLADEGCGASCRGSPLDRRQAGASQGPGRDDHRSPAARV